MGNSAEFRIGVDLEILVNPGKPIQADEMEVNGDET